MVIIIIIIIKLLQWKSCMPYNLYDNNIIIGIYRHNTKYNKYYSILIIIIIAIIILIVIIII